MSEAAGKASRVFVAGHRGMVGSAIVRALERAAVPPTSSRATAPELDLTDQVRRRATSFARRETRVRRAWRRPRWAASYANDTYPPSSSTRT